MALSAGTRLGPYEIAGALGAGGMGEVYKARDTRLDRTVAIKVLPPHVLSDPGIRARFEREARTVSSLDHPNICTLYDVGRQDDLEYLVMQYLDGETLADRLARGPLPLDEALRYGIDIAGALDRAHRSGVLHRDIKPGNVMLVKAAGRDATAKLLDFGLAKAIGGPLSGSVAVAPQTVTSPLTGQGTIVGTLLYMSPEQLDGRDVDARSDIFSFGALLYEMVTGRRAFDAGSQASVIGAILERDPPSMSAAAPLTPPALDRAVRKCLAKDRERRWQSAGDLCDELSWIAQSSGAREPVLPRAKRMRWLSPLLTATGIALIAGAAVIYMLRPQDSAPDPIVRDLDVSMPAGITLTRGGIAVSPDGRSFVFVASPVAPKSEGAPTSRTGADARLYVRRFDSPELTPIAGTEGARAPFFSPDGLWVGYFTSRALMKVSLRGGPPTQIIGTPPVTRGAVWLPDDSIVVAPTQTSALVRVGADGTARPFTTIDSARGERAHLWPQALPGGQDLLFTIRRGTTADVDASDVGLLNVASGERRVLLKGGAFPRYSPTGHLLFVRGRTLHAVAFDLSTKQVRGTPIPIVPQLAVDSWIGGAHYAVAADGTLLCLRGAFPQDKTSAVWVDRAGAVTPAPALSARIPGQPRLSPDGRRALFDSTSPDGDDEIYVADLERGTATRFTHDPEDDFNAIWASNGTRVLWAALPPGRIPFIVMQPADGTGAKEEVADDSSSAQFLGSVSRSGVLAYTHITPNGRPDIYVLSLDGDRKPKPFINTAAGEIGPEFSPDGQSIAFVSDESGASEVYVAPYPGPGESRRVSNGGGVSPAWSRDGRELFYQTDDGMMVVDVRDGLSFGTPRKLFAGTFVVDSREDGPRAYDVSPDGKRFLMLMSTLVPGPPPAFHVLLGWTAALQPAERR